MHAQLCLTVCDPAGCSLAGSSVCGIFPATILEWAAISSSRGSFRSRDQTLPCLLQLAPALAGGFFTTEPHGNLISIPHFFLVFMSLLVVAVSQTCLVDDLGNFEGGWLGINL